MGKHAPSELKDVVELLSEWCNTYLQPVHHTRQSLRIMHDDGKKTILSDASHNSMSQMAHAALKASQIMLLFQ